MSDRIPLLGTGLSGLIGSKLVKDFSEKYEFENMDLLDPPRPVDITKYSEVIDVLSRSQSEFVIHFAAYTNVTGAWEQQGDKSGSAYQVNVIGTENIARAATETGKHLIHISTAYIFNGEKEGLYTEEETPSPIEWYGQTKAWAEDRVREFSSKWTILRIDQPFRSDPFTKKDLVHRIIEGLQNGTLPPQFANHYIGPTFIDDFVKVIEWVFRTRTTGIFNATSGEKWSDFDFASKVNEVLQLHKEVKHGDLAEYLKNLNRPYQRNTALDCRKLFAELDFQPLTIPEAIKKVSI
jgi:dTDP-4-dehydrorhamnose reductase